MNEIPDHAISPFRLTSLTLRGIGSYLHGTRLEIRPLTILCGENGSGKSTWIRMLNILQKSLAEREIPFRLSNDQSAYDYDYTYSLYRQSDDPPVSEGSKDDFGPVGTIGLHFNSIRSGCLPENYENQDQGNLPNTDFLVFLKTGRFPPDTKFVLNFTAPTRDSNVEKIPLDNGFELQFGTQRIRFTCSDIYTNWLGNWRIESSKIIADREKRPDRLCGISFFAA